jgi:hypothetical protein
MIMKTSPGLRHGRNLPYFEMNQNRNFFFFEELIKEMETICLG